MNTLIHLKKMNMFNISDVSEIDRKFIASRDKTIYIDSKKTYPIFCELIAAINEKLWSEKEEYKKNPYYTEMLLFAIADTYVIKDIIENYNRII